VREEWVNDFAADLRQSDTGSYYSSFLADEGPGESALREIKARSTTRPTSFHHNQNIPPRLLDSRTHDA
jgi:hypothetical protein